MSDQERRERRRRPAITRRSTVVPALGQIPQSCWRVRPGEGVRELVSFFGGGESRLFGTLHAPMGKATAGLVICCPLQAELLRNYRREVLLARRLAARGVAVQRFHYRGAGHSDGDTSAMTVETMVEDAISATEELVRQTGAPTVGYLGTRWGGLVAAAASRGAPVALWEPVVETKRYFEEILRFRLMFEIKADPDTTVSNESLLSTLDRSGAVDILGHTLERSVYRDGLGRRLDDSMEERPPPSVLLVQIGVRRSLSPQYASLAAAWQGRGTDVQTQVVRDREAWWLSGDLWPVHETHGPTMNLIDITTEWALDRLGREGDA